MSSQIQSVLFKTKDWSVNEAKKWLIDNEFNTNRVHTTEKYHRFRQVKPDADVRYRIKKIGNGIAFIVGYPS